MKKRIRLLPLLAALLMLAVPAAAEEAEAAEEKAVYTAKTNLEFHIRPEPGVARWVCTVPIHERIEVLEYGEDWCRVRYRGFTGYADTSWLREYICVDPMTTSLPDYAPCTGLWTYERESLVQAGDFSGLTVQPGTAAAVRQEGEKIILPVWRSETETESGSGTYTPFTPWQEAEPESLIAAFTTFYNDRYGAPLARERQLNIQIGCDLINGLVLAPGDGFSFNAVCGPYGRDKGYVVAPNISKEGVGSGGGVCQVSTTLYNALLEIPVQITDWAVHTISGVRYIPVAFDACVGRYSDLCFENTLPYAIRLEAATQQGALTVFVRRAE